jgi:hypothetical protein
MARRLRKEAATGFIGTFGAPQCGECGGPVLSDGAIYITRRKNIAWARCRGCIERWKKQHPDGGKKIGARYARRR